MSLVNPDTALSLLAPTASARLQLLVGLSANGQQAWRLRPDAAGPASEWLTALPPAVWAQIGGAAAAAVLVTEGAGDSATLYLSANAWRTLLADWPATRGADALLDGLTALAPAIRGGAAVVKLTVGLDAATQARLNALPLTVRTLGPGPATPITDTSSLLAALAGSAGGAPGVLIDAAPYTEQNRYAALGIALDRGADQPEGVLIARALLAQILALAPGVADPARATELLDASGAPSGVLRLDSSALQGLAPSDWVQGLVDQGVIERSQVLHTALASAPTRLQAFNDALRAFAEPAAFFAPPATASVLITDSAREALLASALSDAVAPLLTAAADWLALGLQALQQAQTGGAPLTAGWFTLEGALAALVQPTGWPADAAWLRAALTQAGNVRLSIVGTLLAGKLAQPLGAGESLELQVGDQLLSSALGEIVLSGTGWSLDVPDDASEAWRSATLTRVGAGGAREVLQRFELLDRQGAASVAVRLQALGSWYDNGSRALGQDFAQLLRATAEPGPGADGGGQQPVTVEALQPLLGSGALQRVLASRGLVLPAGEPPQQVAHETLQAWAALAQSGSAYAVPAAVEGPLLPLLQPLVALDAAARSALGERISQAQQLGSLLVDLGAAAPAPASRRFELALNLPEGAVYTLQYSRDGGQTWVDAPVGWQPELGPEQASLLLRVRDVVLPAGSSDDFALEVQATAADGLSTSAQVLLQDPTRAHLQLRPGDDAASAWAQATLTLSQPLSDALTLQLALSERGLDGSSTPVGSGAYEVSRDGGQSWQTLAGSELTLAAGEQRVLLRHAISGEGAQARNYEWQLQASGAGASALGSTTVSALQRLVPVQPALTLLARDAGQGEGRVVVALVLAGVSATEAHTLQLQRTPDALLQLGSSELSVDGGSTWQALVFDAQGSASLVLPAGRDTALVRTTLQGLQGTADALALGWSASDASGTLSAPATSVRVWRHDAAQPQAWVSDLRIDGGTDAGASEAVFTVRLSGPADVPVTLDYATALPATVAADPLSDFFASSGHLVFGAGETVRELRVPLRAGWSDKEAERAFELVLSNAVNARLGDASATATLIGARPHLVVSGAQAQAGDGFAYLQAGLSHASGQAIGLQLQLLGDDADGQADVGALQFFDEASAAWVDYVAASGVSLAPGQTALRLRVPVNARAAGEHEADESLTLVVSAQSASQALLGGALQLAAPLTLRGNADAPGLQAQPARAGFSEGAVFELRDPTDGWAVLSTTQHDGLRSALDALGLQNLLEPQLRERLDAQGQPQTVVAQRWLDQLRSAVQQQRQASEHRLLLDELVTLGANAQPDASLAGVLTIGSENLAALLDRLSAAGLTVHSDATQQDLDQPGALRWDGTSATAQVGAQTLAAWSDQLQRQQAREAALALRLQLALLVPTGTGNTTTDDALPIALGDLAAGQQWRSALADAGVLLLDPTTNAYDPDALGAIFRRTDADGVERLYVSPDTLTAWSTQLGVRAAWLNSTAAGGSSSFTNSYFNDQDPLALDHFDPGAGLDHLLLIYAVAELSRSAFMLQQAGERERVRLFANRFYQLASQATAPEAPPSAAADTVVRVSGIGDGAGSDTDSSSSDDGTGGQRPDGRGVAPGAQGDNAPGLFEDASVESEEALEMREINRATTGIRKVQIGSSIVTEPQLDHLLADARYRSLLLEGELFSSAAASVVLLAAVAAAAQAARDDSAQGAAPVAVAHDALLASQFLFQGLQQSLWLAGQLAKPSAGEPPAASWGEGASGLQADLGRRMLQNLLQNYAPTLELWEAAKVYVEWHGQLPDKVHELPVALKVTVRNWDTGEPMEVVLELKKEWNSELEVYAYSAAYEAEGHPTQFFNYFRTQGPGGTPAVTTRTGADVPFTPVWADLGLKRNRDGAVTPLTDGFNTISLEAMNIWLSMDPDQRTLLKEPEALDTVIQLFTTDYHDRPLESEQADAAVDMLRAFVDQEPLTGEAARQANQAFERWLRTMRARDPLPPAVSGARGITGELAEQRAARHFSLDIDNRLGFMDRLRRTLGLPLEPSQQPDWFRGDKEPLNLRELYALARDMHISLGQRTTAVLPYGMTISDVSARTPSTPSARLKLAAGVLGAMGDVIGVAAAVAGVVAAAEALKAMDDEHGPDTPERRRARGQLVKELAVQTSFALGFTLMGSGNIIRLLNGVTDSVKLSDAVNSQLMGAAEFIGSRIAVAGLALGFATELISGIAHATRWGADPSHASDEDIYGTFGGLGNATAYGLTLAVTALAATPEFAVIAMPLLMLLPDLSAIGRGHDTERRVTALRDAGRDAEADLMQTLAALAYRQAIPVFGAFSALYAKEIVRHQLGSPEQQQQLLDDGARTALENTAQDKLGKGTANFESGWTHGFLNFGAPINLVVPLNAYLTGDGAQIDWNSGFSFDTDTFRAMAQASAAHMQRLMGQGNWFQRAFTERLQSQLLHWQSPQAWADQHALELADTSAVLRTRAARDYSNQMTVDHGSKVTEDLYAVYDQMAARLKQYFDAGQLRQVGNALVGPGSVYVGNIAEWRARAAQVLADDSRELPVEGEDARKARAQRYEASVMLAAYHDTLALAQVHAQRDAAIAGQGSALAPVDQWAALLRGSASASDLFVIASRAEAFALDPSVYARTQAHSNYSAHADDAGAGNTEWVDGSYKLHLGQYQGAEGGTGGYWGGWQDIALPEPPTQPGEGASEVEVLAYNQAVALYNERVFARNAHLASYLQTALGRDADQRGADPGAPPAVATALAGLDPGGSASAAQRLAFEAAQAAAQRVTDYNVNLVAQRVQLLEARAARLQNGDDGGTRLAVQQGLGALGYTLDTRFSGNAADSVAERWVIRASELTRDAHGEPLGSEVQIHVLDEGGNTARALAIDSSALDDVDQVVSVERINVQLRTGDGDDSFVLSDSEGIAIDAGDGLDRVFFTPADHGLTIDADRLRGVDEITGSEHDDVVSASGDQDLRYTDQIGLGLPGSGRLPTAGDQVRLLGNGRHTVLIGAGQVQTGGGDDLVLVREHAGGSLDLDLGSGTNAVSFALLPGVRLQRDFGTGDYSFKQVTWVLTDGSVGDAPLGWGLNGTLRQVQQLIGSAMGDVFELDGGIQALNAGGGDDRIDLASGDVVVDGGAGSDAIAVRGAHNTALRIDDAGDRVSIAARVQDVRIAVGARVLEDASAASGAAVQRGEIDASGSLAALVIDIVDGTVRVKAGSGPLTINLLSASARVVIEDSAERIAAGATITLNLMPGAPLDALGLRAQLTQDHELIVLGSNSPLSLLGGQVLVEPVPMPASPTTAQATHNKRALQGMQLHASDLNGHPLQIALDEAVPVAAPSQAPSHSVGARDTGAPATTLHAWAGVRTVLDLQSDQRFSGAYSAADAQARAQALTAEREAAHNRQASAGFMLDEVGRLIEGLAASDNTPVALLPADLGFWATQGGARIAHWVFNASDLLRGWRESLPSLGWTAEQLGALDAALQGHAVYAAREGTLLISAATRDAWRTQLQAVRAQTRDAPTLGQLDRLDTALAAVAQGVDARAGEVGALAPDLAQAQALLKALLHLGVLSAEQAQVITRVDLYPTGWSGGAAASLPRATQLAPDQLPTQNADPLAALRAAPDAGTVVFDSASGHFLVAHETLRQWLTDGQDQQYLARLDLQRLDAQLASVAPYLLRLASGAALYMGLANDTTHDTLEVSSATPLQQALSLQARNGDQTASTPLWLQVERFEGLTRVGDDGEDTLVASGAYANLLAGGRGNDSYTVRDDKDVVFENAAEGFDTVNALGTSCTLGDNLEDLHLAYQGAADAALTLHGTGNALRNVITGHSDFANRLDGGAGHDVLQGGRLADTYIVDSTRDFIIEADNSGRDFGGTDWVYSSVSYSLGEGFYGLGQLEHLRLLGSADLSATGNALDNRLVGNAGKNRIDGGAGNDTVVLSGSLQDYRFLYTSAGEWVVGDKTAGRDNVDRWSRIEAVRFEASGQTLTLEQLIALGQTGSADVHAALAYTASYPDLTRAFGANELAGLEHYFHYGHAEGRRVGFDALRYQASNIDVPAVLGVGDVQAARHYIQYGRFEGRSTDSSLQIQVGASTGANLSGLSGASNGLFGSEHNDILRGSDGSDGLIGGGGNDWLDGGAGDDRIAAGAGNDELIGGRGNELLLGGSGSDTYRFARGDGQDRIVEAGNDGAAIDRLIFEITGAGAIGFDQLWFASSNGGRDLSVSVMGTQDSVTIQNGLQGPAGAGIEAFTAADRYTADPGDTRTLSAAGLERLVSVMATLAPPAGATSWSDLSRAQRLQLQGLGVWQ